MGRLWETTLNLLYPPTCCACGTSTVRSGFCVRCLARIDTPCSPLCPTCGVPFETASDVDHLCQRCLLHVPRFGRARACTIYDAADSGEHPLRSVLQRYKYHRDISLARPLAQLLANRVPLRVRSYDCIIPVPLHLDRLRWRGFNQAQLLADSVSRASGVPIDPFSLQRTRPTRPQVELNETERRHNVAGAFRVTHPRPVADRRVLLVDDVYTTGATVRECTGALLRAGARTVDVLVLARAVLR